MSVNGVFIYKHVYKRSYTYANMSTKDCTPMPICNPKSTNTKFTNTIIPKPHNLKAKQVLINCCC